MRDDVDAGGLLRTCHGPGRHELQKEELDPPPRPLVLRKHPRVRHEIEVDVADTRALDEDRYDEQVGVEQP